MISGIVFLLIAYYNLRCVSQRNAAEEAICSKFLTSPLTVPLNPQLERNLTLDEEGEFSCNLVLQDRHLPNQIRLTINEGLYTLALRHFQSYGLQRQRTIFRHLKNIVQILPNSFYFSTQLGSFALDPNSLNLPVAVEALNNALYGNATTYTGEDFELLKYSAKRDYAKALGNLGRYDEALSELVQLWVKHPFDFKSMSILLAQSSPILDNTTEFHLIASHMKTFKNIVKLLSINQYDEFIPCKDGSEPCQWHPHIFDTTYSPDEILEKRMAREPFIISFESQSKLDELMHWNTKTWRDMNYIEKTIGQEEELLIEQQRLTPSYEVCTSDDTCTPETDHQEAARNHKNFGSGLGIYPKMTLINKLIHEEFIDNDTISYLNLQYHYTGEGRYRSPLHKLKKDIEPLPSILSEVENDIKNINLWWHRQKMNSQTSSITSQLHRDAMENLYILLQGKKEVWLLPPIYNHCLNTISSIFATHANGLSFSFNINKFRAYYIANHQNVSQSNVDVSKVRSYLTEDRKTFWKNYLLQNPEIDYETLHDVFVMNDSLDYLSIEECSNFDWKSVATRVALVDGDMLYIPTGWFHEVTTKFDPMEQPDSTGNVQSMAINYWWKPHTWEDAIEFEKSQKILLFDKLTQILETTD